MSERPDSLTWEAVARALREMEWRYDDLRFCNKADQCHTKAEGARLAIEDFNERIGPEAATWLMGLAALRAATPAPPEPALRDDEVRLAAALVYIGIAPAKSTERARSVLRYLAAIPEKP